MFINFFFCISLLVKKLINWQISSNCFGFHRIFELLQFLNLLILIFTKVWIYHIAIFGQFAQSLYLRAGFQYLDRFFWSPICTQSSSKILHSWIQTLNTTYDATWAEKKWGKMFYVAYFLTTILQSWFLLKLCTNLMLDSTCRFSQLWKKPFQRIGHNYSDFFTFSLSRQHYIQLNKYETAPNFILLSQNLTSDCLLI